MLLSSIDGKLAIENRKRRVAGCSFPSLPEELSVTPSYSFFLYFELLVSGTESVLEQLAVAGVSVRS
jgi:hypothetical protein